MFPTLADLLHEIVSLLPWREEARKLAAHEAVDNHLGASDDRPAHAAGDAVEPNVTLPTDTAEVKPANGKTA